MPQRNQQTKAINQWLSQKLQLLRKNQGLTRQQLAARAGITGQQLYKYERGLDRLSVGRLLLLAQGLNLQPAQFWEGLEYNLPVITARQRLGLELAANFVKLRDPCQRKAVHQLIKALAVT